MASRDINQVLIGLVEKHSNLFDKSLQSYKDVEKKNRSWASITIKFNNATGCRATGD